MISRIESPLNKQNKDIMLIETLENLSDLQNKQYAKNKNAPKSTKEEKMNLIIVGSAACKV